MARISRYIVTIICIISCVSIAAGPVVKPTIDLQTRQNKTVNDPYATIFVEAYVVEVKLSALYDSGVSLLGEKSKPVSIENILHFLQDKNIAKISSGAKVAVQKKETGNIELEETIYLEQVKPIKTNEKSLPAVPKSYRSYKINKALEVSANFIDHNRISVSYAFSQDEANEDSSKNHVPPTTAQRLWVGKVSLEMGKASIVGATQDEKKVVFLILSADIKDSWAEEMR